MSADFEEMKKLQTMTMKEFMAWLDGYSENFNSAPNEEQWKKVLEKLKCVQDLSYCNYPWKRDYTGAIYLGHYINDLRNC